MCLPERARSLNPLGYRQAKLLLDMDKLRFYATVSESFERYVKLQDSSYFVSWWPTLNKAKLFIVQDDRWTPFARWQMQGSECKANPCFVKIPMKARDERCKDAWPVYGSSWRVRPLLRKGIYVLTPLVSSATRLVAWCRVQYHLKYMDDI